MCSMFSRWARLGWKLTLGPLRRLQQQMKREGAQGVDSALVAGMVAQHTSALRNKRLVLAYLYVAPSAGHELPLFESPFLCRGARARRIEQFRWEYGSVLLDTWRSKLSTSEVDYFKVSPRCSALHLPSHCPACPTSTHLKHCSHFVAQGYNDALNTYMRKVGIDLTADTAPPKHLDISVRVLDDVGEIMTAGGEALRLRKHDVVRMRRVDAEQLIRQGKAKQLDS